MYQILVVVKVVHQNPTVVVVVDSRVICTSESLAWSLDDSVLEVNSLGDSKETCRFKLPAMRYRHQESQPVCRLVGTLEIFEDYGPRIRISTNVNTRAYVHTKSNTLSL